MSIKDPNLVGPTSFGQILIYIQHAQDGFISFNKQWVAHHVQVHEVGQPAGQPGYGGQLLPGLLA